MKKSIIFWVLFPDNMDTESLDVDLDFEWELEVNDDVMKPALDALKEYMEKNYKGIKYDVGYWWWKS